MRVLLVDDHRLVLKVVRRALERAGGIEVVGEATSGAQVLPLVRQTDPDLVLLDVALPDLDGLACLAEIRKRYPAVTVVMLSAHTDSEHVEAALAGGASGYIGKNVDASDLPSALARALAGGFHRPLEPGGEREASRVGALTEREIAILRAVARGLSNRAIANEFWLTEQTVKFHLTKIYRKLGVANRTEATRHAYRHGLADAST
ncbi:MAG: response regulator transcription factor [Actinomycetota bacterium]|nr:response regulator transcription factor [Actinomycetota bacterium]